MFLGFGVSRLGQVSYVSTGIGIEHYGGGEVCRWVISVCCSVYGIKELGGETVSFYYGILVVVSWLCWVRILMLRRSCFYCLSH